MGKIALDMAAVTLIIMIIVRILMSVALQELEIFVVLRNVVLMRAPVVIVVDGAVLTIIRNVVIKALIFAVPLDMCALQMGNIVKILMYVSSFLITVG